MHDRLLLQKILKKMDVRLWTKRWVGSMADSCKHGNESSGPIQCGEYLDQMDFSRIPLSQPNLTYNVCFERHTYEHDISNTLCLSA
jgi:hypothetical protein